MSEAKNIVNEQDLNAYFEKAEMDQLRAALKRTHAERFLVMTKLMKRNLMFRKAKITHQPLQTS